jgi:hypothetical protein
MTAALPASMLALAAGALAGGAAAPPDTAPPTAQALGVANRLQATFTEAAPLSRTPDCAAGPRICQAVLEGRGSLQGFGGATEITGLTQDRAVRPCGLGSDSEVFTRRIETSSGILALRGSGVRCPTPAGMRARAQYEVDGTASTGVFAGASGRGRSAIKLKRGSIGHVTTSGTLKLRRS